MSIPESHSEQQSEQPTIRHESARICQVPPKFLYQTKIWNRNSGSWPRNIHIKLSDSSAIPISRTNSTEQLFTQSCSFSHTTASSAYSHTSRFPQTAHFPKIVGRGNNTAMAMAHNSTVVAPFPCFPHVFPTFSRPSPESLEFGLETGPESLSSTRPQMVRSPQRREPVTHMTTAVLPRVSPLWPNNSHVFPMFDPCSPHVEILTSLQASASMKGVSSI
jgi:hypothetical protein